MTLVVAAVFVVVLVVVYFMHKKHASLKETVSMLEGDVEKLFNHYRHKSEPSAAPSVTVIPVPNLDPDHAGPILVPDDHSVVVLQPADTGKVSTPVVEVSK